MPDPMRTSFVKIVSVREGDDGKTTQRATS